jgi:DNA modification methylase
LRYTWNNRAKDMETRKMKLIHGDCLAELPKLGPVKCAFFDPPDNISLQYDEYLDKLAPEHYYLWIASLLRVAMRTSDIIWLSYNQCHDLDVCSLVRELLKYERPSWSWKKVIWTFTFGNYNDKDFGPCFRPILRLMKHNAVVFPDAVREESERMRIGDSRSAGPKVPGDVWEYPRVTGNSSERQAFHPTQHPVALYKRIMDFSCGPGDTFVDGFAGSGTCFRAGFLRPDVNVIGIELSDGYCGRLRELYPKVNT